MFCRSFGANFGSFFPNKKTETMIILPPLKTFSLPLAPFAHASLTRPLGRGGWLGGSWRPAKSFPSFSFPFSYDSDILARRRSLVVVLEILLPKWSNLNREKFLSWASSNSGESNWRSTCPKTSLENFHAWKPKVTPKTCLFPAKNKNLNKN